MVLMLALPSSSRSLPDPAANVRVRVSGGVLCERRELGVRGLPSGLFPVPGRSELHPVPERTSGAALPAGRPLRQPVCRVSSPTLMWMLVLFQQQLRF